MQFIIFSSDPIPNRDQVGGKAHSLFLLTRQGFDVPPGFTLTLDFFNPWIDVILSSSEWQKVIHSQPGDLKSNCNVLKALCQNLAFNNEQRKTLEKALSQENEIASGLLAVRSSAPDEDDAHTSFAGGYETLLGVNRKDLESAIQRVFASSFDERVFLYKTEHGISRHNPGMAVIVQQQLNSEKAGVAFSLNPENNCFDEALINANYGLGESVVSGKVTPDSYLTDKVEHLILKRTPGRKESIIQLSPKGGIEEISLHDPTSLCLSDKEVMQITELLIQVEKQFGYPVDIEWAFTEGKLSILQARPITTYIPLPKVMLTPPGKPKKLYLDMMIAAQGIDRPFSTLGLDYYRTMSIVAMKRTLGIDKIIDLEKGLMDFVGCRAYLNLSNYLRLPGRKKTVEGLEILDALTGEIIHNLDMQDYRSEKFPTSIFRALFDILPHIPYLLGIGFNTSTAFLTPNKFDTILRQQTDRMIRALEIEADKTNTLKEFIQKTVDLTIKYTLFSTSAYIVGAFSKAVLKRQFDKLSPATKEQMVFLEQSLPNNVTIDMGLSMFRLAQFDEIKKGYNTKEFLERYEARMLSPEFINAWDTFMNTYGFRCPMELDVATPRLYEQPEKLYENLLTLSQNTDKERNPLSVFNKGIQKREQAYEVMIAETGPFYSWLLGKLYPIHVDFSAYREIPKYYGIMMLDRFRKRVLIIADVLLKSGRIDEREQVFDLTIDELDAGLADTSMDLRAMAEKNTRFYRKIKHIKNFPRIIDSRGRILRPPEKEIQKGEITGTPISPGKTSGTVKVLHYPDEKPVLQGEILVTRATDPGWTPLFLNAAGIILEVGGSLQHGALIAREYGKPCVAGIENITDLLKDGECVELDGTNGTVRLLSRISHEEFTPMMQNRRRLDDYR